VNGDTNSDEDGGDDDDNDNNNGSDDNDLVKHCLALQFCFAQRSANTPALALKQSVIVKSDLYKIVSAQNNMRIPIDPRYL
jgi:hypothetical protein